MKSPAVWKRRGSKLQVDPAVGAPFKLQRYLKSNIRRNGASLTFDTPVADWHSYTASAAAKRNWDTHRPVARDLVVQLTAKTPRDVP